ncbi:putative heat shock trehalose synthase [Aspergillus bombycis]|uniref:Putative heat shock trehalose synthase n=1 Tax=Aspergillus bombycis TaxID=109264 RepID=A0A1F7ZWF6_9EURO|nr:putative heat shock trehalose synthase [Aspergillus bombycis]OGM43803.1 putative heat shock trehalose synthase [Aspergillus bombycis]
MPELQQLRKRNHNDINAAISWSGRSLTTIYAGISILHCDYGDTRAAIAFRNSAYLFDYVVFNLPAESPNTPAHTVCNRIISELRTYSEKHTEKITGLALPLSLADKYPSLCSQLWRELDILPLVLEHKERARTDSDQGELATFSSWNTKELDEQADSMARKCMRSFGVGHVLQENIGLGSLVEVDRGFRVRLANLEDYQETVTARTWSIVQHYAEELKRRNVKIAFFSLSSHGRPDIHTRHSLVRLLHYLGVNAKWYVPKPRPGMISIIRKMQDSLEGLNAPGDFLTIDEELLILQWVYENARRYRLCEDDPLQARSKGGADIVIIDDVSLTPAALLSKQIDPKRPVIFENRVQIQRSVLQDLRNLSTRPWDFLRERLKYVDLVVSQGPKELVPDIMPEKKVGYIPVSVDQLDGSSKTMRDFDITFYGREFNSLCRSFETPTLNYPEEQYILHLSQFRNLDETLTVLHAYHKFFIYCMDAGMSVTCPKLLIYHYGPSRSSKSTLIYDAILSHIEVNMPCLRPSIYVMQIGPPDQLWNALLTKAKVVIELSMCEGIPAMLLAAVQKGKPVITVREMSQFSFTKGVGNILFFEKGDVDIIAGLLVELWTDSQLSSMLLPGPRRLRDEYTTVGNAVNWLFLAAEMSREDHATEPDGKSIFELACQGASFSD